LFLSPLALKKSRTPKDNICVKNNKRRRDEEKDENNGNIFLKKK
jgi:hypothetical protein